MLAFKFLLGSPTHEKCIIQIYISNWYPADVHVCFRKLSWMCKPCMAVFEFAKLIIHTLHGIIGQEGSKCAEKYSAPPGAAENEIEQF